MDVPGYKLGRQYECEQYYQCYSALNLNNHKTVNIQFLNPALVANQLFLSQFKAITRMLVGRHIGIMSPILQTEASDHTCYVISENYFSPQQVPSAALNLTRHEVLQFALQIAQTLDELHKIKLVHGGIELSSLCFKTQGHLILKPPALQRVIDILRPITFKSLTEEQRLYLAPEAGKGLTPATDFYALGILIYQLLFGPDSINTNNSDSPENHILNSDYKDLEYLFRKLLSVDVEQRVQNLVQFKAVLMECDVDLSDTVTSTNKAIPTSQFKIEEVELTPRSNIKWIFPVVSVVFAALVGSLYSYMPREEIQLQSGLSDSKGNDGSGIINVENRAADETLKLVKSEDPVTAVGFKKLYQQALNQIEINPKIALMIINVALKYKPEDTEAIKLKQRINNQIEIDSILYVAESQLTEGLLISPKGNNAYESYQSLAKVLSPDDERVHNGFTKIATAFYILSHSAYKNNQLEKALEYIDQGLSVKSDYSKLKTLRNSIIEQQELELSSRETEQDKQNREQRLKEFRLRNKQTTDALIHRQLSQINQREQPASDGVE
jgi:serine/threonine protein kinase